MKFCYDCGEKLELKECNNEGLIPYCKKCENFKFPIFSTAISTAVFNENMDKVLLIQQYGRKANILVAGYVNKGEDVEHTLIREVKEEIGLDVIDYKYMQSKYYKKSNTLMINFRCRVKSENLDNIAKDEVDRAKWFTLEEAREAILKNSLAEEFLIYILEEIKN